MHSLDAIVLAGGRSERLGADKTRLTVDGRTALDTVLSAASGAARVVVVGPARPTVHPVTWTRENPPGSGPAAAVAAGMSYVRSPLVLVLAGDLPGLTAGTVDRLAAAAPGHDGAVLVDGEGRRQHLTVLLDTATARGRVEARDWAGASMRMLLEGLDLAEVPAVGEESLDLDTVAEVARWQGTPAGVVEQLWRYPVKSLAGEQVTRLRIDDRGVEHDRWWAVCDPDGKLGSGKSSHRFRAMPGLMRLRSELVDGVPRIRFPDGMLVAGDDPQVHAALSEYVGRPVRLQSESTVSHLDESPVHLVTTGALDWLTEQHGAHVDQARMRPNVLVRHDTPRAGDDWVGHRLVVGDVVLEATHHPERCVMVTQPQDAVGADRDLLHTITRVHHLTFGVNADVVRSGTMAVGDQVYLLPAL